MPDPVLAVVVPVFDGSAVLPATVPAMMAQDTPVPTEWVFVDDGSRDGSAEVLERLLAAHPPRDGAAARILRLGRNRGRAEARQTGVEATAAPVVAFLDCDVAPEPGCLRALLEPLRDARVVAVVGRTCVARPDPHDALHAYFDRYPRGPRPTTPDAPVPWHFLTLGVAAVRRAAFEEAGGLRGAVAYGEDIELGARLARYHPDGLRHAPGARGRLYALGTLEEHLDKVEAFGREHAPVLVHRHASLHRPLRFHVLASPPRAWLVALLAGTPARHALRVGLAVAPPALRPLLVRGLVAHAYARGVRCALRR